jgi:hypothetical protein
VKTILWVLMAIAPCMAEATIELSIDGERISLDVVGESLETVLQRVSGDLGLDAPDLSRVDPREKVDISIVTHGKIELVFERLLRNYNYIFKYDQAGDLKGVTILGRKSSDVGPYDDTPPDMSSQQEPLTEPEEE